MNTDTTTADMLVDCERCDTTGLVFLPSQKPGGHMVTAVCGQCRGDGVFDPNEEI
jgi:DnaJ-class molecular chaperone